MDLWRIAVRAVFVYLFALGLVRASGKRSVRHGNAASFVLALILGDMIEDALWGDVPMAQFVVGSGTLALVHVLAGVDAAARQRRQWTRTALTPRGRPSTPR